MKLNPELKEKLRRAIRARLLTSIEWAKEIHDPDSINIIPLAKKITETKRKLNDVMREL